MNLGTPMFVYGHLALLSGSGSGESVPRLPLVTYCIQLERLGLGVLLSAQASLRAGCGNGRTPSQAAARGGHCLAVRRSLLLVGPRSES